MKRDVALSLGAGLAGATLMYFYDPVKGRGRRAVVRDKVRSYYRHAGKTVEELTSDAANRVRGVIAEGKAKLAPEPVNDDVLVERVRARLGRLVDHPHAVRVEADRGLVTLHGPVPEHEVAHLLRSVACIPGVRRIVDRLNVEAPVVPAARTQPEMASELLV